MDVCRTLRSIYIGNMNGKREEIIRNYIEGYNEFDVDKMVRDFSRDIIFKNIQNGEINIMLNGLIDFKHQAEQAKSYFESRRQQITAIYHRDEETEIEVDYSAVAGADLPNGLRKGEELKLKGISIFKFDNDRVVELKDIS